MTDVAAGDRNPCVHAFLVAGDFGCREIGLGEGTDGNGDQRRIGVDGVPDDRAAHRAEAETPAAAIVAYSRPFAPLASEATRSAGKRAWTPKLLPVRRWQERQWQTEIRIGSPSQAAVSAPHEQDAIRRVIPSG